MKFHHPSLAAITGLFITSTGHSAVLLQDYDLGGIRQTVSWEATESAGTIATGGALSSANPSGTPTSGVGTVSPTSPGFRAGSGYYSFSGNFGMTASTSIQSAAFADIQNVVFQRTSILNPGDETAPLTLTDNLMAGGGPTLTYYLDGSSTAAGSVAATYFGIGAGEIGSSQGNYHAFTYQWDLSGVAGNITSVSIAAPILVHSSTVEARIDISSGMTKVIPEPASSGLLAFGLAGLLIRRRR